MLSYNLIILSILLNHKRIAVIIILNQVSYFIRKIKWKKQSMHEYAFWVEISLTSIMDTGSNKLLVIAIRSKMLYIVKLFKTIILCYLSSKSSIYFSAATAAVVPSPTALVICLTSCALTSPQANMPFIEVSIFWSVIM